MKKVIKNISRVLFSLLLIVSIFGTFNVLAEEVIFKITNISVKEKSDKVTVNEVSLSGGSIVNDIVFTEKDDYITYNITIKNNTEDDYTIKSITDDNTSPYLKYTYDDSSNVKVESGKEKTFNMTVTYIQETTNLTISDQAVSLTLTYEKEDGTTGSETITDPDNNATTGEVNEATENITNPKTGDNITIYIILGLVSLTGLVITTVSKKHLKKSLMVIALVSVVAIPLGVKADSESFKIVFKNNIQVPHYTITYNANGGKYNDNSVNNDVSYSTSRTIKKYSHTLNIDDNGIKLFGYEEDSDYSQDSQLSVVTIDGASSITVDVYFNTVYDDSIRVIEGAHPNLYTYSGPDFANLVFYSMGGPVNETHIVNGNELVNVGRERLVINGNSVTFYFNPDGEDGSYGYYAVVAGEAPSTFGIYEEPTREGFIFKGWYDDPECTDGHEVDINSINSDKVVYAKWKDPNVLELGDEYCIGDECFHYLRHQDSTHIVLYAKYPYNDEDNRQETTHGGYCYQFTNSSYWGGDSVEYPIDVYNGNNYLKDYINNYVNYLKTNNLNVEGRILNYDDLVSIGVDFSKVGTEDSLANVPTWFKEDSTFTSVATSDYTLYRIHDGALHDTGFSRYAMAGRVPHLKPVIVLEVDN